MISVIGFNMGSRALALIGHVINFLQTHKKIHFKRMILYWPPIKEHVKIIQLVYFNLCISKLEGFVLMSAVE